MQHRIVSPQSKLPLYAALLTLLLVVLFLLGLVWRAPFLYGERPGIYWFIIPYAGRGAIFISLVLLAEAALLALIHIRHQRHNQPALARLPMLAATSCGFGLIFFLTSIPFFLFTDMSTIQHTMSERHQ